MTALTVATYNIYLGADLALLFDVSSLEEVAAGAEVVRGQLEATDFTERATALARILVGEQPDLIGLQEVCRWTTAPLLPDGTVGEEEVLTDFLPVLLDALADQGTVYDAHAVNPGFSGGLPVSGSWMSLVGSNVVLVPRDGRFAVTEEGTASFTRSLAIDTGIEGIRFPIARGWGWVDGAVEGRPVRFANTHLEAYDAAARDAQRDELLDRVGDPGCPVIVVGDFNARPHEVGVPPSYADAWLVAGGDPDAGFTCGQGAALDNETSALHERIDYVFVRNATVTGCRVVGDQQEDRSAPRRLWPSDHAGVVATLGF